MQYSQSQAKALEKAQTIVKFASTNRYYVIWKELAIESFGFYDGVNQYHPEILEKLKELGQSPIVVNKVMSIINQGSGTEINTRGKIAFKPHSNKEDVAKLTKAMTHYGYAVQENQDFSFKGSLRCRDVLICGLGLVRMESYDDQIHYSYVNPSDYIWDAEDSTPQLTNQRHGAHLRWLTPEQIKEEWPRHAAKVDDLVGNADMVNNYGNSSAEFDNRNNPEIALTNSIGGLSGSRLCVYEVFYKQRRKYYCGLDRSGYYFETFDEDEADELAENNKDIKTKWGTQIMRTVYCDSILLDYAPLSPNSPNRGDFPVIPCVWQRRTSDGVPVGWLECMKDSQRELNYRKLKEIRSLNSKTVIIDHNAFHGQNADDIADQLRRDDAILFKTGPGEVKVIPNLSISEAMVRASERIDHELQQVSGMYSDSLGEATNATSGVAIKARQIGSSKNLAFGFDAFNLVKKREGKMLIDLMQSSGLENMFVNIVLDNDEKETFVMNLVREVKGKKIIFNDIRTIPVDVFVEIVPDYDSSRDEEKAAFESILMNQRADLILQNPYLIKIFAGDRNADKISEAMQAINQQSAEQQMMIKGGGAMPPSDMPQDMNPTQLGAM